MTDDLVVGQVALPSPKSELFAWCARCKVKPPVFVFEHVRGTFEGTGELKLPDGTTLKTQVHTATAKKPAEQAACAELLAVMARLFGPTMVPPRSPKKKKPKGPAAKPSPEEIAAARAAAKQKAREERQERLKMLLKGWSPANAREVLSALTHESYVRRVRVRVAAHRAGRMLIEASCERPDGSMVHLQPFWAATKEEGEGIAAVQFVESVALCTRRSTPTSTQPAT